MEQILYKAGDKVRFTNMEKHMETCMFFPLPGTTGTIITPCDEWGDLYVEWEAGSTSLDDRWYCSLSDVELVEE